MLVHPHDRSVDHLDGGIMGSGERIHDPAPDPGAAPAHKAVVAGGVGTKGAREVTPRGTGPQHPKDAIQDTPIVYPWHAASLVGQHRSDGCPFIV